MNNYDRLQAVMLEYSAWVRSSAQRILQFIALEGKAVVDFGCGNGDWLLEASEQGATTILGLETYALAGTRVLPIPTIEFDLTKPVVLDRQFDLALCLEVGEHIQSEYADDLVASLTRLAPLVLFSAAVPSQGGVGHVNEQPPAYWAEKFQSHDYACFDFRREIWADPAIEPWYAMNVLAFAAPHLAMGQLASYRVNQPLHLIHPAIFGARVEPRDDIIYYYDREPGAWRAELLLPEFGDQNPSSLR